VAEKEAKKAEAVAEAVAAKMKSKKGK